jgi:hypothetical protein
MIAARRGLTAAARPQSEAGRWEGNDIPVAATPSSVETLPGHGFLGRLVGDLAEMLRLDRVAVVVADPGRSDVGVVAACVGAPGMLGTHIPLCAVSVAGFKSAVEAAHLGLGGGVEPELPWSFARVPIAGTTELLGTVTVVSRWARCFTEQDLIFIERIARRRVPEFDRRRRRRRDSNS